MKLDLHIHTNHSLDGTYSVKEILNIAQSQNMDIISITDHNSIANVQEAIKIGKDLNILVIPGIEIDCVFEGINFHMTAYGINFDDKRYGELEDYYVTQAQTNTMLGTRRFLEKMDLQLSDSILKQISIQGVIVPEDLGHYLLTHHEYDHLEWLNPYRKNGNRSDNPNVNFYWDFFSQGKIGYVHEEIKSADEIIELIHSTNGKAFVAHPGANFRGKDEILKLLLSKVDGLEVFSTYHSDEEIEKYNNFANEFQLLVSRGSDFHGTHKPAIQIGEIPGSTADNQIQNFLEKIGVNYAI